ncbi:hypothetical protein AXK60_19275 [Tsukamurella pseudospumae]|uniref:Uncharacterized protein n=2 Tax=Tsukamurella pseudospumae TaxID=239498 RepID=A0A138A0D9_9ACTN|nr:hypothetical protein AXK61_10115 [Tsukamurella pseudospumae]KXP03901.1 hypothetical protein AXK60_19275 [Tsukamurella pseudospumae]
MIESRDLASAVRDARAASKSSDVVAPIALHDRVTTALETSGSAVPEWFAVVRGDLLIEAGLATRVHVETPCFWSGETSLAQFPGVITTNAGWIDGDEVVEVHVDPASISLDEFDRLAREEIFARTDKGPFRLDRQPQFYLEKSPWRAVPMTGAQRTAVNLAVAYGRDPAPYLSPRQLRTSALPTDAEDLE